MKISRLATICQRGTGGCAESLGVVCAVGFIVLLIIDLAGPRSKRRDGFTLYREQPA
jgi:hypothetical protein